jgi:hypothetical protein
MARASAGPVSGLRSGDRVRTVQQVHDISWAFPVPAGSVGRLGSLYRVQDGLEVWQMFLDRATGASPCSESPTRTSRGLTTTAPRSRVRACRSSWT